jgi:hypothetical protein
MLMQSVLLRMNPGGFALTQVRMTESTSITPPLADERFPRLPTLRRAY